MRITDVLFSAYRWPRARPIRNGLYTYTDGGVGVVEIVTDEGPSGVGLTSDPILPDGHRINQAIVDALRPMLVGQDPLDHERLWSDMWQPKLIGRRGLSTRTISAIDIALWDLKAKRARQPLYQALGGYDPKVPCYAGGIDL